MRERRRGVLDGRRCVVPALVLAAFAGRVDAACLAGRFCAGAASVDMTWHVGSGQGQYGEAGNGLTADRFDPFHHQTKMVPSHGMQSRLYAKAIVVQGADGAKAAFVKTDLYLQQDVLTRRIAELVSGGDPLVPDFAVPGLDGSRIILGATHNHSAPEYVSTAWGVWLFTDAFDFRAFETIARQIAEAIWRADQQLVPAKMGGVVLTYDEVQHNILGPAVADDGSPAGFPYDYFDDELAVLRFETDEAEPRPIAAWVNLGMHPESLSGVDFISSDFTGIVERIVERELGRAPGAPDGPVVVWGQGAVGDVEPDRDGRANPQSLARQYWHKDFSQAEKMSRKLGAAVLDAWNEAGEPVPTDPRVVPGKHVPLTAGVPVGMVDYRFSGPPTHPVPTVSNCRTGRPGVPVVGLPDCERDNDDLVPLSIDPPEQYGETLTLLRDLGIPVPDNYGVPSYEAVQESLRIHLQALRLGEVVLVTVPGEPISDMVRNAKSRLDLSPGVHDGFEWPCTGGPGARQCNFRRASHSGYADDWRVVSDAAYDRMVAEIHHDAAGWEDEIATLQDEASSTDPAEIRGNFTKEEIQDLDCGGEGCAGFAIPIVIGQANDYVGYVVTYREYSRGDHYRKALTAFGPRTSDYVNTRLVRMAAELRGASPVLDPVLHEAGGLADEILQTAKAVGAGAAGGGALAASAAALPDDGGAPGTVLAQPSHLERFAAATFTWEGGSNWTDNPVVVVERLADANDPRSWETAATQEGGEVVLTLRYDSPFSAAPMDWLLGAKRYEWTAIWEAFETTPPGTYRFLVTGHHRTNGQAIPYVLASAPFDVSVWSGLVVHDLTASSGAVTFRVRGLDPAGLETDDDGVVAPDEVHYPDTGSSGAPYISTAYTNQGPHRFCYRCTWRPWANTGKLAAATVLVNGAPVAAAFDAGSGVFSGTGLEPGDEVEIPAGGVLDEYGNTNGVPAAITVP